MSVKIQFAFQGGGARLALLLPVVQAILEDEDIEVTRVAGTSAGAIAAVLLAGRANMSALVTHLREMACNRPQDIRAIFPAKSDFDWARKLTALSKLVFWNRAIVDEARFSTFLGDCLRKGGIEPDQKIGNLGSPRRCPCKLVSADVTTKDTSPHSDNEAVLQALVNSAAVPFIFRTTGQRFDGGLVDNLPINHLTPAGKDDGEIIAVAFNEDAFVAPKSTAISLALSLLDSAMTSKTRSTRNQLGENFVLSLSPYVGDKIQVDSFDVDGFIEFMASELAYKDRLREAKDWLKQRVSEIKKRNSNTIILAPTLPDDATSLYANIAKVAERYHELSNIEFVSSSMDVISYSLGDPARNDLIRVRDEIRVVEGQANIYVSHLFSASVEGAYNARYQITDGQGRPIDFAVLEVPIRGRSSRSCVIVFSEPLRAGTERDTAVIVHEQDAGSTMKPLLSEGADYLSIQVSQGLRATKVEIGLAVPSALGKLLLEDGTPDRMATLHLDPLAADALVTPKPGRECPRAVIGTPQDFVTYGWLSENLTRGEITRVIYRTTGNSSQKTDF